MDLAGLADLDESLFEVKVKEQVKKRLLSYNAKFCEPQWFSVTSGSTTSCEDNIHTIKYVGDAAYHQQKYEIALHQYEKVLKLLPTKTSAVWRDIQESIARCHIHLGNMHKAENSAMSLHKESVNYEQKSGSLKLLTDLYKSFGNTEGQFLHVQQLAALHPLNADIWIRLADLYAASYLPASQNSHIGKCPYRSHMQAQFRGETGNQQNLEKYKAHHHLALYTCLMRALLLVKSVQNSVASFIRSANIATQVQLKSRISCLEDQLVSPEDQAKCLTFLTKDVTAEQILHDSETLQEEDIEDPAFQENFEKKWFSWTLLS